MPGLFHLLYRFKVRSVENPLEDYLTELFAYCLQLHPELWLAVLRQLGCNNEELIAIQTQVRYPALERHETNSKPDIVAYTESSVIFFECKIGAKEGYQQLTRYAEHIDKDHKPNKFLIYITRDFDPKVPAGITENCHSQIRFIGIRWYQIFNILKPFRDSEIILELIHFMKQIKIAMNNQFTPSDIIALSSYMKMNNMMKEIILGEVEEKFRQLVNVQNEMKIDNQHLNHHGRFLIKKDFNSGIWVGLGFWLASSGESDYPEVRIKIESSPDSPLRATADQWFLNISRTFENWSAYNTNNPTAWSGVDCKLNLQQIIAEEDHLHAVRTFLLAGIDDLQRIKEEYPQLLS